MEIVVIEYKVHHSAEAYAESHKGIEAGHSLYHHERLAAAFKGKGRHGKKEKRRYYLATARQGFHL